MLLDDRQILDQPGQPGNTSLVDAGFSGLVASESGAGRALLIVFSDGLDTASFLPANTVLETAKRYEKAVEINGLPDRIDLRDAHVRLAVEAGVPVVCSTDAHSIRGLGNMGNAVATARRGWATAADVLNTRPLAEILSLRPR